MFRLFNKDFAEVEHEEMENLKNQCKSIRQKAEKIEEILDNVMKDESKRSDPEQIGNVRKLLQQILVELHDEEDMAKDAIRDELQRERIKELE